MIRFVRDYCGWMTQERLFKAGDITQLESSREQLLIRYEFAVVASEELAPPQRVNADDLTRITGIGPKMARQLAELGIVTFADLAQVSAEWLDERIPRSAEQIEMWQMEAQGWI